MGIEIGQTISHYKILRKLGHGGMGDVYLAENTRLGLKVALKFLAAQLTRDAKAIKRLEHEARAVAELSHPNISRIYDIEEADGHRFLVLEYLEGETLSDRIQRGPLSIEETIRIGKALAEGLAHAHSHGIVHRDIKSPNVMMTSDAGVKIMDFGLARMPDATRLTESGEWLGTVSNMSPEQASGETADERSDLWSLGVVLYQCVTGRLPFEGESAPVVLNRIGTASPAPPTSLRTGVPMDLDRTILRCLEKDPSLRYQTADDLLAELRRLEGVSPAQVSDATTIGISSKTRVTTRSSRRWVGLLVVATVVIVAAVWRPWERGTPIDPNEVAETAGVPERPNWILVADFVGPPVDPNLAVAARELINANLEQSRIVTPLSRGQLKRGLRLAMMPDTTAITGNTARELAIRAAAKTYVVGRIDRIMQGFSIVVRALDAETDQLVASVSEVATNEEVFISKLDRLGRALRDALGEHHDAIQATKPLIEIMTPSLEAYRLFLRAAELVVSPEPDHRSSNAALKRALALDSGFTSAWRLMGHNHWNLGFRDSALAAYEEARRRPERLTQDQRISADATFAIHECDYVEALRLYGLINNHNPRGGTLRGLGRNEEALEAYIQAGRQSPYGPATFIFNNQFDMLVVLGRYQEAADVAEHFEGAVRQKARLILTLATSNWSEAGHLAEELQGDVVADAQTRFMSRVALASIQASRGEINSAVRILGDLAENAPNSDWAHAARLAQLDFWILSLGAVRLPNSLASVDTSTAGRIVRGAWAAALGDSLAVARRHLDAAVAKPCEDGVSRAVEVDLLRAWIAARESLWEEVIALLESARTTGPAPYLTGRLPIRWLVAHAFERLGQRDDAAEAFELVLSPRGFAGQEEVVRAHYCAFAHHRLVLLYSKMGRVEDARRHWEIFEKTFTNPDPELVPMVEEAKRALEEAEARAAS